MEPVNQTLLLYAVCNQEGKWFRARGLNGSHRENWVSELKDAKIYSKIGPARSRVTYFTGAFPEYGTPDIVELSVVATRVLNEKDRVSKVQETLRTREARQREDDAKRQLAQAEEKLAAAQLELSRLKRRR